MMDPIRLIAIKDEQYGKMIIYLTENGEYDYIFEPIDAAHYDAAKKWARDQMQIFLNNIEKVKKLIR